MFPGSLGGSGPETKLQVPGPQSSDLGVNSHLVLSFVWSMSYIGKAFIVNVSLFLPFDLL